MVNKPLSPYHFWGGVRKGVGNGDRLTSHNWTKNTHLKTATCHFSIHEAAKPVIIAFPRNVALGRAHVPNLNCQNQQKRQVSYYF